MKVRSLALQTTSTHTPAAVVCVLTKSRDETSGFKSKKSAPHQSIVQHVAVAVVVTGRAKKSEREREKDGGVQCASYHEPGEQHSWRQYSGHALLLRTGEICTAPFAVGEV